MLKEFIASRYDENPAGTSRFTSATYRLVRVTRRLYRGHKKIDRVQMNVEGTPVSEEARTAPSWKLMPKSVAERFDLISADVDGVIYNYCLFRRREGEARLKAHDENRKYVEEERMFGEGVYLVDVADLPQVDVLLRNAQREWAEEADKWTTEDGYERFHALLKEQIPEEYDKVKELVPDRHALRAKFNLGVRRLPFQLAEDTAGDPEAETGRKLAVVEMLDLAVRQPREEAAAQWRELAAQLVEGDGAGGLKPLLKVKQQADGTTKSVLRSVKSPTLNATLTVTLKILRAARTLDDTLKLAATDVSREIPAAADAQKAFAQKVNQDDARALEVGRMLVVAADAAEDEAGMCSGLGRALSGA